MSETCETRYVMTPKQRELARHALGLSAREKRAYRNSYVVDPACEDHDEWTAMVEHGAARVTTIRRNIYGGMDVFWLTHEGATLALGPRETLGDLRFPEHAPAKRGEGE